VKDLSIQAKLLILSSTLIGFSLSALYLAELQIQNFWLPGLAGLAALAQVLKVEGATERSSYNISWVVYGFTFAYLGIPAVLFVILIAHLVEWAWHKYPWYIQLYNIAAYAIPISAAGVFYSWINPTLEVFNLRGTLGILGALFVFTVLNHLMIGLVIWLARGERFSTSGVFELLTLMIDFTLMGMGVASALIWLINPSAAILNVIPLYLVYSVLKVPALQRQTEIDQKTQLFNARYFADALAKELVRAERFDRPLTVVMGDLDLLRNINNTYGHLAGDVVLIEIAKILKASFRDYDIVARFGGEEFAILMPETAPDEAFPRIEKVRCAIEVASFDVTTSLTPIKATMSFGIAGRSGFAKTPSDLIHNSDLALYHAKLNGRNLTTIYTEEGIENLFGADREAVPHADAASFKARIDHSQKPFEPNPLRERSDESPVEQPARATQQIRTYPGWMLNAFIGGLTLLALGLIRLTARPASEIDWFGLLAFALIVLLMEGLAIEIYIGDTTVSTSAAPLIAGVILFGYVGAVFLSLVLTATALIRHHSPFKRFFFNFSNHLVSTLLGVALLLVFPLPFEAQPVIVQISLVVLSAVILYTASTGALALVINLSTGHAFNGIWRERFRWLAPYYLALGLVAYSLILSYMNQGLVGVLILLVPLWMLRFSQVQYIERTKSLVSQLRSQNVELAGFTQEITNLNDELLTILATAIDVRDPYTLGHSQQVARYAVLVAKELGLPPGRIELIRKASLLHDLGKLGVADAILFKNGALEAEEYEQVKTHASLGASMIDVSHILRMVTPIIRHHHERFDGAGYPDGLQGQEIPLEARILSVVDALEAMSSDRPYRKALELEVILSELQDNAGRQFDPLVIEAVLSIIERDGIEIMTNSAATISRRARVGAPSPPV
jgi:diguanylate cyclase (GGDEF)-like protein/putative nucleotidyltransferase with HDIG domain